MNDSNQPTRQPSQVDSNRKRPTGRGRGGGGSGRANHNHASLQPQPLQPTATATANGGGGGYTFHGAAANFDATKLSLPSTAAPAPASYAFHNDPSTSSAARGGGSRQSRSHFQRNKSPSAPQYNAPPRQGYVGRHHYPTVIASRSNSSGAGAPNQNQLNSSMYNHNNSNSNRSIVVLYPPYWDLALCLHKYSLRDPTFVRGKLRVLPGKDSMLAFVACDRGSQLQDVIIPGALERNRALDGDMVYVEFLFPDKEEDVEQETTTTTWNHEMNDRKQPSTNGSGNLDRSDQKEGNATEAVQDTKGNATVAVQNTMNRLDLGQHVDNGDDNDDDETGDTILVSDDKVDEGGDTIVVMSAAESNWQDDPIQMELWNPAMTVPKPKPLSATVTATPTDNLNPIRQRRGRVVFVIPPKSIAMQPSEINTSADKQKPSYTNADIPVIKRIIVGRLQVLKRQTGNIYLLIPMNRSLPEFKCLTLPAPDNNSNNMDMACPYKAEYIYGSWKETFRWPPCYNLQPILGGHDETSTVEVETAALLPAYGVDHGEFTAAVLRDVDSVVQSGVYTKEDGELEWKPTPEMLQGRRDYRNHRIFTIDPTTARDLDDALHIQTLPDGRIEIGVHIADVSHFVTPDSEVDREAERRATTVYLVDRVIPMLPRPLCEIACSLNENVERLAFSCVWTMHTDGTLAKPNKKQDIWYGRTVIKSCARLDYATAQNIIDGKVASGEAEVDADESLWPLTRRPTGGHTVNQVAGDVRLMHKVAMARRRLRFQNGALALNGVKLTFQLDSDGETPLLCSAYPIRDSNRLVEEYMLLANYFVAQKLATDAGGLALLRRHPPPLMDGIEKVVNIAKVSIGFDIDATSSETLQKSLNRLTCECDDEIVLQCITALLTAPMQPALYFAVDDTSKDFWQHFALHIPFYTHFTSPIRRYPDVLVHRLLQATIDGEKAMQSFSLNARTLQMICDRCNEKKEASRGAQQRGDIVFLALYLKRCLLKAQMGIVLSVGVKTFTVFVPSIGLITKVYLDEHDKSIFSFTSYNAKGDKRIKVEFQKVALGTEGPHLEPFHVKVFAKLLVTCACKDKFPIDVKVVMEGPWKAETSFAV